MLRIGAFEAFPVRNQLVLGETVYRIEPLVMDVLVLLAQRPGELVERGAIIDHVWMSGSGGDESLTRAIGILRRIFADDPDGGPYVETVWKRGYCLVAEVGELASVPATADALVVVAPDVDEADVPGYSVAILPFANASFEAGDMFLADGITRDLTMLLSRVPRLKVAAYSSALLCREGREPLEEIATRLGVRYVVSGSVARDDTKIFLRAALMDSQDNAQLLGKRLGAPIADFFEVQDELVLEISTALASGVQTSHVASLQGRRPFQLSAYELVQRAEALRLRYNRENAMKIVGLLDQALRIDPDDAAVHAALAVQHTQNVVSSFVPDQAETFALARRHVDRALDLAPRDPDTLAAAGIAATMMGNARLAVRHLEAAVDLDPNNPHTLAVLGWQHCWIHGTLEGLDMIRAAEDRAPHHPRFALWAHYRGHCEIRLGHVEGAVTAYGDGVERNTSYSLNLATLVAALGLLGREDEALAAREALWRANPDYGVADLEMLAKRMVYWFGTSPSREAFIGAFRRVLEADGVAPASSSAG